MSAIRLVSRKCAQQLLGRNVSPSLVVNQSRHGSQYFPIDDQIFGLTEEQQQVYFPNHYPTESNQFSVNLVAADGVQFCPEGIGPKGS